MKYCHVVVSLPQYLCFINAKFAHKISLPQVQGRVLFIFKLSFQKSLFSFFQSLGPTLSFMRLPRWQLITQLNEIGSRTSVEAEKKLDIQLGHQSSAPSLVTLTNVNATVRQ